MPVITQTFQNIKDGISGTFRMAFGTDGAGTPTLYEESAVIDPVSGNLQSVDGSRRAAVAASDGVEVSVSGSQYNLTVPVSGSPLTLTVPSGATHAWIYVDANSTGRLRLTRDGATAATASIGAGMEAGDERMFTNLANLKFFAEGGAVTIHVSYHHF